MPETLRPDVEPPRLNREALRELRRTILEVLAELEAAWERRN